MIADIAPFLQKLWYHLLQEQPFQDQVYVNLGIHEGSSGKKNAKWS